MRALRRVFWLGLVCALTLCWGSALADSILMFSAEWCGPCKAAKADFEQNKEEVNTWGLEVVDSPASPELTTQYKVGSVPTFIYLNDAGEEIGREVGYTSFRKLRRWVGKYRR